MSILLQSVRPWIAQSVYETITFDRNNYDDNSSCDGSDQHTSSAASTKRIKFDRRPRLAQVIEAPTTTLPSPSTSATHQSGAIAYDLSTNTATATSRQGRVHDRLTMPITRLIVSDGSCTIPVYIVEKNNQPNTTTNTDSTTNNGLLSNNNADRCIIKKGAVVSLRNWAVACTSLVFQNIDYKSSSSMCLIVDERFHPTPPPTTTTMMPTAITTSTRARFSACIESMGGEGMSIVNSPLDVHNDVDVKRALIAVYDPVVLVRQILECHNFQMEMANTTCNNVNGGGGSGDQNYNKNRQFKMIMGCNDEGFDIVGTGVLDSDTITKVIEARYDLTFACLQDVEKEVDETINNWEITQDSTEDAGVDRVGDTINDQVYRKDGDCQKSSTLNQESSFTSIEQMLASQEENGQSQNEDSTDKMLVPERGNDENKNESPIDKVLNEDHINKMMVLEGKNSESKDDNQSGKMGVVDDKNNINKIQDLNNKMLNEDLIDEEILVMEGTNDKSEGDSSNYKEGDDNESKNENKADKILVLEEENNECRYGGLIDKMLVLEERNEDLIDKVQVLEGGKEGNGSKSHSVLSAINKTQGLCIQEEEETDDFNRLRLETQPISVKEIHNTMHAVNISNNISDKSLITEGGKHQAGKEKQPICVNEISRGKNQGRLQDMMPAENMITIVPVSKQVATGSTRNRRGQTESGKRCHAGLETLDKVQDSKHIQTYSKKPVIPTGTNHAKRMKKDEITIKHLNRRRKCVRKDLPYNISGWLKQQNLR